jgi:transcriptional regulator with GAF, ATPase, and Fis domain
LGGLEGGEPYLHLVGATPALGAFLHRAGSLAQLSLRVDGLGRGLERRQRSRAGQYHEWNSSQNGHDCFSVRSRAGADVGSATPAPRDDRLRAQLVELLTRHAGNVAAIAREVGKHRRQIHRWLDRLDLDPDDFRAN